MRDQPPQARPSAGEPQPQPQPQHEGFSTSEKVLGAAAVYKAPLLSSVAASAMLQGETDPVRRRQLLQFRKAALIWMAVGAVVVIVGLVVVASMWTKASGAGKCRDGAEPWNAVGAQYVSTDNVHWMATVPCYGGGQTDVPVPPGGLPPPGP